MEGLRALLESDIVREHVERAGGPEGVRVMEILVDAGSPVTDEYIAGIMGVKVTVVRSALNRLHFWGLVDYHKERDEDTGWYTYTWFVRVNRLKESIHNMLREAEEELRSRLEELENFLFFECPKGHSRMVFEVAMEHDFRCPQCGEPLKEVDVEKEREEIRKRLADIARVRGILRSIP